MVAIFLFLLVVCFALSLLGLWLRIRECREGNQRVHAVKRFKVTYITGGLVQKYHASWNPSPSAFVEKHELRGVIGTAGDAVLVPDLPSSAFECTFDVMEGQVCDVYLRTYGDNGTSADSEHARFTAKNEQAVAAVTDFAVVWQANIV